MLLAYKVIIIWDWPLWLLQEIICWINESKRKWEKLEGNVSKKSQELFWDRVSTVEIHEDMNNVVLWTIPKVDDGTEIFGLTGNRWI